MGKGSGGIWIAIGAVLLIVLFVLSSGQEDQAEEGVVIELETGEDGELQVKEVRLDGEEMEEE